MKKLLKLQILTVFLTLFFAQAAFAESTPTLTISQVSLRTLNSPEIYSVTGTTATVKIPDNILNQMSEYERQNTYFEYYKTGLVCPAIYPTPEYCLPKKIDKGVSKFTLSNLEKDTTYTIVYKRDNSIACITAPCPTNDFRSDEAIFTTAKEDTNSPVINLEYNFLENIKYKQKNSKVLSLQKFLHEKGFLKTKPTGYFGSLTLKAVKDFQKSVGVSQTGFVGPATREQIKNNSMLYVLNQYNTNQTGVDERFSGAVETYSIGCFSDGECSVTVDGKKVITTIGWTFGDVGSLLGVGSLGDVFNRIGSQADVYAKKIDDKTYTLYGNTDYYVRIK